LNPTTSPPATAPNALAADARDRLYARVARATTDAGRSRESLFLARLALLLFEQVGDEAACERAIQAALAQLPEPSLSAGGDDRY
jgi:hypothetical protein